MPYVALHLHAYCCMICFDSVHTQEPVCKRVQNVTSDARGCEEATMPRVPRTGDLLDVKSMS